MADNIKVVIKVRPLIKREIEDNLRELWTVSENSIYPTEQHRDGDNTFTFDHIFDCDSQTKHVYNIVARPIVEAAVDGINGTIFAYGQTSSGKTYTMMGDQDSPGVIPLAVQNIFTKIVSITDRDFLLRVSYIEIYNEKIRDLLDISNTDLKIHEDYNSQLHVKAKEEVTTTAEGVLELMKKGNRNRAVGETQMNERSSRSHTIFYIIIESRRHVSLGSEADDSVNVSQLNLVDLAGSERAGQTAATKQRLREGGHINKSLSSLGLVIRQLSDPNRGPNTFISFRDSKLTHFLRNSLGGNSKTGIICAVTPAVFDETHSTLMFAMSAKVIQNIPKVNAVISDATLIKKLTKDMALLQEELENKRLLEHDNKKLQEQLGKLQHMILMGHPDNVCSNSQKAASLRRRTWCAPRSLPPILEHNTPQTQDSLNYPESMLSNANVRNVTHRRDAKTGAIRDVVYNTPQIKMQGNIDIIELDDTPDASPRTVPPYAGSITPPTCSPNHKCFSTQQTPPCVLKYRAQHAEKEFKELEEMTSLEKMFEPKVVELLHDITVLRQENEKCSFQIENQNKIITSHQEEIIELKDNLESLTKENDIHVKTQAKLQEEVEKCRNINTDLQFEIENLKQRSQNREKELLTSLKEARDSKDKGQSTSRTSLIPQFLNMSRDLSLANSDLDTTHEDEEISEKDKFISKLQDELKSASKEIDILKDDLETKVGQIKHLEDQLNDKIKENCQVQNNITELTNKECLNAADADECTVLKTRISELEELIRKKDASNYTNMDIAQADIKELKQTAEEMETKNFELTNDLYQCQKQIEEHLSKIKIQGDELELARDTISHLNDSILKHKQSLSSLEQKNDSLLEDIKSKDTQIMCLQENDKTLNSSSNCDELEEITSNLKSKEFEIELQAKLDKINELSVNIDNLNERINNMSEEHSKMIINKENIISELKSKMIDKDNELSNCNAKYQELLSDIDALKTKAQEIDKVDDLQAKLTAAIDSNQNLIQQNIELENKCQSLQNDLSNINTNIENISMDIVNKDLLIKSLTDENNNLNQLIKQKDSELEESQAKMIDKDNELSNCNTKCQELLSDIDALKMKAQEKDKVDDLQEKLTAAIDSNQNLIQQNIELENKCQSLQNDLSNINTNIENISMDIVNKDLLIKSLTDENNNLNQLIKQKDSELEESRANVRKVTGDLQVLFKEKELLEKQHQDMQEVSEKIKIEKTECAVVLENLRKELESKCIENSELNHSLLSIKDNMNRCSEDITEKTTCIDTLQLKVNTLSQELSESADKITSSNNLIQDLTADNDGLRENIKNILHDIATINNNLLNTKDPTSLSHTSMFCVDCGELNTLDVEIRKLINENVVLKNENLLAENKENVSLKMEKTPLQTKYNQSFSRTASPLDSIKSLKSPKCASPQNRNKDDVIKDILGVIDRELENIDGADLTCSFSVCTAELSLILNKINNLQTSLQNSDANNSELKEKVTNQENELCKIKESLTLIDNSIEENHTTDATHSNFYSTIKYQIQNVTRSISQFLDCDLTSVGDSICEHRMTNQDSTEHLQNLKAETTQPIVNPEDVKSFADSFERNILDMYHKFNFAPEDTNTKGLSTSHSASELATRLTTLRSLYDNFCNKIEKLIAHQNEKMKSIESKYSTVQTDMLKAETAIHTLCGESEELFKKIVNASNESMVSDVETPLKSFILCATEHHHNTLHSACMNALSFIKKDLYVLQKFLQNPRITHPDFIRMLCDMTAPGLEVVETPIKDFTSKIVATRTPKVPCVLFPAQENTQENVVDSMHIEMSQVSDNFKSDYENMCLENKRLLVKLEVCEPLAKQYDDLVRERDSLSSQLMDSLEDLDNLKSECSQLKNKLNLYAVPSCDNVNVSVQTHSAESDTSVTENIHSNDIAACYQYIMEKIVLMKKDFDAPSNNLMGLLLLYTEELNNRFSTLQDEMNTLNDNTSSLQSKLSSKSSEIAQLEEKIICHNNNVAELQNNLISKDNNIRELQNQVDLNKTRVVELTIQLDEQSKCNSENNKALIDKENCIECLKKQIHEKDIHCEVIEGNMKVCESEKIQFINQINELETKLNEVKDRETCALQLNEEYNRKIADLELRVGQIYSEKVNIHDRECAEKKELQNRVITLQDKIKELESNNAQSKDKSDELKDSLKKLVEEQTQLKTQISENEEYCKVLQEQIQCKITEMKDLENDKVNIESQLTVYAEEKCILLNKIKELENKLMVSENTISDLEGNIQKYVHQNNTLSDSHDKLKEQQMILSSSLNDLTRDHQTLTTELQKNEIQLSSLSLSVKDLQTAISQKDVLILNITAELKEKSSYLTEMKEENSKYISEKKLIEEEKLSLISNNEDLSRMLSEKDSEINDKNHEISQLRSNHRSTASLQFENEKLKHQVDQKNKNISFLEEKLVCEKNTITSQLEQMSSLKSANSSLEARLADVQSELSSLLRSSPKFRKNHLQLKRQSLHDLHRNLSSSNENCNDVSMEDCTVNNHVESKCVQDLEDKCKVLQEKFNNVNSLYSDTLDKLNRKTEEHQSITEALTDLQVKYEAYTKSLESKVDASTNTSNNAPEDIGGLMDMFVDKLTYNVLKEKYNKLTKMNEELRIRHREQVAELRRLQHSLQNNTLNKLLPHDEQKHMDMLESKLQQSEMDMKALKEQLDSKQKEYNELENKYNEMDKEYDDCAQLYQDSSKRYNMLADEKLLLEVRIRNLEGELSDVRRGSPGRDSRRKRQSMQDYNRGISLTTTEASTNTSPKTDDRLPNVTTLKKCEDCESNRINLEQLKIQYNNMLTRINVQPPIPTMPYVLPSSVGSGIVQSQQFSDCLQENRTLKLKLAKYKELLRQKMNQQRQQPM